VTQLPPFAVVTTTPEAASLETAAPPPRLAILGAITLTPLLANGFELVPLLPDPLTLTLAFTLAPFPLIGLDEISDAAESATATVVSDDCDGRASLSRRDVGASKSISDRVRGGGVGGRVGAAEAWATIDANGFFIFGDGANVDDELGGGLETRTGAAALVEVRLFANGWSDSPNDDMAGAKGFVKGAERGPANGLF
jgi:hypothetical protein